MNAERIEQGRGGRVHVDVRTRNVEAALLQHPGDGRHGCSGDAKKMDVFSGHLCTGANKNPPPN